MTLEELQEQRAAIMKQMGSVSSAQFSERMITYRPQQDLEAALRRVDAELRKFEAPDSRLFTIQTSRGL